MEQSPKKLAEAALFMATEPMDLGQLAEIMSLGAVGQAKNALAELIEDYKNGRSALEVTLFEDKYRMRVKDEYLPKVAHLTLSTDYSRAALKTLSVVAFKQPILQSEVVKYRGQGTYEHVKDLATGGLISRKPQGRSRLLATTKRFEEYFGTSADKLKETYGDIEFLVPEGEDVEVQKEGVGEVQEKTESEVREEEPEVNEAQEEIEGESNKEELKEESEPIKEEQVPEEESEEPVIQEEVIEEQKEEKPENSEQEEIEDDLLPSERAELKAEENIYSEDTQKDTDGQEG
jgi:segregation and condensation protein B